MKNSKYHISQLTFLLAIFFGFCLASGISQTKTEKIDALIQQNHQYGKLNGSVLVSHHGEVLYKEGVGMANMEWDIPNQANTKHRLGSITKQFTAVLILQLAEQGQLDLQESINKYLPGPSVSTWKNITTHHLLTHTSGIPNYTALPGFFKDKSRNPYTPTEFVKEFADLPLDFQSGEKWIYSNSGYFLLGVIIENLTGKTYEEVLQEKILDPLEMNDTGYDNHSAIIENRAAGYEKRGREYRNADYLDMSIPYAAGSMYSTVEDLYKWDKALYSNKLLSKKYKEMMFSDYADSFGTGYGYGWSVGNIPIGNTSDSLYTIGHGGGINGFNTLIIRIPADTSAVILLNNTGGTSLRDIATAIFGILYDKTYDLPKQSLAFALYDVMDKKGKQAGLAEYKTLQNNNSYTLNESEMNSMGYQLLQVGKVREAEAMFQLNVEAFPNSYNAYDSYAESLMTQGKKEEAVKNYRKSIEMNPGNQNGIDMLTKMGVDPAEFTKKVEVSEEVLSAYLGKFELMPNFILTFTKEGSQLIVQATGQPAFNLTPTSQTEFFISEVSARLVFKVGDNGEVNIVTLYQGGQELEGKRVVE